MGGDPPSRFRWEQRYPTGKMADGTVAGALEWGRGAFSRQAWAEAFEQLSAADREKPLEPADLERLARTADLVGQDAESANAWSRAYQEHLDRSEAEGAARCAIFLALKLLNA